MPGFSINEFRGDGDSLRLNVLGSAATRAAFTITGVTTASNLNGLSWTFSTTRNDYYVWYNLTDHSSGPLDPARAPAVGIPVSLTTAAVADGSALVAATLVQLQKLSELSVSQTASVGTVTERAFEGPVTAASSGASGIAVGGIVAGIAQRSVDAKFVVLTSAGNVEAIFGQDGSAYDTAASTYRIDDINKEFGSRSGSSGTIVPTTAAADTVVKSDNLALAASTPFAGGSLISGVS